MVLMPVIAVMLLSRRHRMTSEFEWTTSMSPVMPEWKNVESLSRPSTLRSSFCALSAFARPIVEDQPEPMHNAASKPLKGGRQPRE